MKKKSRVLLVLLICILTSCSNSSRPNGDNDIPEASYVEYYKQQIGDITYTYSIPKYGVALQNRYKVLFGTVEYKIWNFEYDYIPNYIYNNGFTGNVDEAVISFISYLNDNIEDFESKTNTENLYFYTPDVKVSLSKSLNNYFSKASVIFDATYISFLLRFNFNSIVIQLPCKTNFYLTDGEKVDLGNNQMLGLKEFDEKHIREE